VWAAYCEERLGRSDEVEKLLAQAEELWEGSRERFEVIGEMGVIGDAEASD